MRTDFIALCIVAAFGLGASAHAEPKSRAAPKSEEQIVSLGEIDGEADDKFTAINVRMDQKPRWARVAETQDHGSFLQVVLPDTLVPEPGRFIEIESPYVKKIAVFQLNQKDAGVRIFVTEDAALTKQATAVELLDKRLVLTIDHAKLKTLLAKEAAPSPARIAGPPVAAAGAGAANSTEAQALSDRPVASNPGMASAADIVATTEVERDLPAPADVLKKPAKGAKSKLNDQLTGGASNFDLREKLTQIALFIGLLLVGGLGAVSLKPYLRRRRAAAAGGEEQVVGMKTLANLPLAARQRLTLIQVGDEKILIGVTPDQISYITTVGAGARISMQPARAVPAGINAASLVASQPTFGKMIEAANASATMEMRQMKPMLKNIEGNDEANLRRPKEQRAARTVEPDEDSPIKSSRTVKAGRFAGGRVNIAVGEDGVKDLRKKEPARQAKADVDDPKAIDDVTRLIREKLKSLRTI